MNHIDLPRRRLLKASLALPAVPLIAACAAPLPVSLNATTTPAAKALLMESAQAHGLAAYQALRDVSVSYAGEWRNLIGRIQPALVDPSFRAGSEERLLLRDGIVAQAHTGPGGRKQVLRRTAPGSQGEVKVWFNGEEARDVDRRTAAALVADNYCLFLLGPMLLVDRLWADRVSGLELSGTEWVDDQECDVLRLRLSPGIGLSTQDQLALFIDRKERLMRRVRFTLDGFEPTRGGIAEVETFDHQTLHGVRWPTRFYERVLRPIKLPAHDWRLTGLDVNRGLQASELESSSFSGAAAAPAARLKA
jgi:hypothetical protein